MSDPDSDHAPPLPDIVQDSRLPTELAAGRMVHSRLESDPARARWPRLVEETWLRRRELGSGAFGSVCLETCISGPRAGGLRAVKEIRKPPRGREGPAANYAPDLEATAKFSHERVSLPFPIARRLPLGWDGGVVAS